MSTTSTTKSDYLLLFRGNVWDRGLSPAQLQKVVSDWMAWFERLKEEGKCLGAHPLEEEGKVVSGKQGRTIADGPFAESKEAIGGYFYLQVADENEAIEIAKQCPGLEYGAVVKTRTLFGDFDRLVLIRDLEIEVPADCFLRFREWTVGNRAPLFARNDFAFFFQRVGAETLS